VVVKPTATAAKPAKETVLITCCGIPTMRTGVMVVVEPDDHSDDVSREQKRK
jgi:hypothetical protein